MMPRREAAEESNDEECSNEESSDEESSDEESSDGESSDERRKVLRMPRRQSRKPTIMMPRSETAEENTDEEN